MDFRLTDEQTALRATLSRWIERDYDFETRWRILRSPAGWSETVWQTMSELGITALPVPESAGGIGGGGIELMLTMEALGRGLVLEPYLGCVVLPARVLAALGLDAQTSEWLGGIAQGRLRFALAWSEPGQRYERSPVQTRARVKGGQWRLSGRKVTVLGGDCAHHLLVTACAEDDPAPSLFAVASGAAGVTLLPYPLQDHTRGADIVFADAPATLVGRRGAALEGLEAALDTGEAALCAEAVGAMDVLAQITAEYLKTRRQFGRPIGSNQALQHRAVDMLIEVEMARSMAIEAALATDLPDAEARARAISGAKLIVARASRFVGQQAVQLHGGIGVTHELNVSHYFKRLTMISLCLGDIDWHLERYGASLLAS